MNSNRHDLKPLARLYLWATHRLYNEFAWAYDLAAWIVSAGRWDRWRRMALDYAPRGPLLEVGFGTGELLIELARQGWPAVGLDPSPAMQRVTARKMRRRGLWAPRLAGRAQSLPFADNSFAAIIATFPAEYVLDPATLREFERVLRPGGRLIIVGLVILVDSACWRALSRLFFGAKAVRPLASWQARANSAGLDTQVIVRDDPPVRVPIIVAEKRA